MANSCEAPRMGPPPCWSSQTYAENIGTDFQTFQILYLVLSLSIFLLALLNLLQEYQLLNWNMSSIRSEPLGSGSTSSSVLNNRKSILIRLLTASALFLVCSIDPFGYSDVLGIQMWILLSALNSCIILGVCISTQFACTRAIALVTGLHKHLPWLNSVYSTASLGMLLIWVCISLAEILVNSQEQYLLESIAFILSSLVLSAWTLLSFAYTYSSCQHWQKKQDQETSSELIGPVRVQESERMHYFSWVFGVAFMSSLLLVAVSVATVSANLSTQQRSGLGPAVPRDFEDLVRTGLFEISKQVFCLILLLSLQKNPPVQLRSVLSDQQMGKLLVEESVSEPGSQSRGDVEYPIVWTIDADNETCIDQSGRAMFEA